MAYTTVKLDESFPDRYKFYADLYNVQDKKYEEVLVFLDTGCGNTLMPKYMAEMSGRPLPLWAACSIMSFSVKAQMYSIDRLMIGDVALEHVIVLAAEFEGELADNILLGTNVMNNWKMFIDKDTHEFSFTERVPANLPNRKNIYQNYFDGTGNYVGVQEHEGGAPEIPTSPKHG